MYSDLYFREKRTHVTSIIGVLAAVAVIGFLTFYFSNNSTPTRASQQKLVQKEVVNVTTNQAGIFWQTDGKKTGWVIYGEDPDNLDFTASDERGTSTSEFQLHFVMLKNLKPDTTYYYKIVSGNEIITDEGGMAFSIKTPRSLQAITSARPAYGKVSGTAGAPAEGVLVMIKPQGSYPLMAVTKGTGEWLIPMQYVLDKTTMTSMSLRETDVIQVEITDDALTKSRIEALVSKLSPMPQTVVLGNNYTFIEDENVLPASTSRAQEVKSDVMILFPKESAVIPGSKPIVKGYALPNRLVSLVLDSTPVFNFKTTANDKGEWDVTVPKPLNAGSYTLTLKTVDADNKEITITRTFTIAKSGEQVLGDATAAGTITPTTAPTVAPTATTAPTSAPLPTTAATTPTMVASASATPTAAVSYVSPTPALPVSGGNGVVYTMTAVGLLIVGAGALLLL